MKRKFILLPITLTTLAPAISLVGCKDSDEPTPPGPKPEVHKVKIDSSSDTTDINISTPKITLNQKLVIPYEVTNPEKELDADNSWLKFDSTQYPLSNPEFSHDNNKVIIPTRYVTTYDITICLKSKTWTVTEQEMVDAIKLSNVNYAQLDGYGNTVGSESAGECTFFILSPNVSFNEFSDLHGQIIQHKQQNFVFKESDGTYTKHSRSLSFDAEWTESEGSLDDFYTTEKIGALLYDEYQTCIKDGCHFLPDETNKCYTAVRETEEYTQTLSFYFKNKKLDKLDSYFDEGMKVEYIVQYFNYEEYEPQIPDCYNYDIENDVSSAFSAPILTTKCSSVDTAAEYQFAIDCSLCEKSPIWESPTSYIEFRDASDQKLTDLDLDVLFYSTDGTVFEHVSEEELDEGLYYCKENMICAQTFSNIGSKTKFKVLLKFNNHNGEDINVYWSNQPLPEVL